MVAASQFISYVFTVEISTNTCHQILFAETDPSYFIASYDKRNTCRPYIYPPILLSTLKENHKMIVDTACNEVVNTPRCNPLVNTSRNISFSHSGLRLETEIVFLRTSGCMKSKLKLLICWSIPILKNSHTRWTWV